MKQISVSTISALALAVALGSSMATAQTFERDQPAGQTGVPAGAQTGAESGVMGMNQQAGAGTSVDEITGMTLVDNAGEKIGDVEEIVRDTQSGQAHAVVSVGGFLGMGEKQVTIPASDLQMQNDQLIAPAVAGSQEQLTARPEYREDEYRKITGQEQVQLGGSGAGAGVAGSGGAGADAGLAGSGGADADAGLAGSGGADAGPDVAGSGGAGGSFDKLDKNQDGYISFDELQGESGLSQQWADADRNRDSVIDRSEFSALEEGDPGTSGQQQPAQPGGMDQGTPGSMGPGGMGQPGTGPDGMGQQGMNRSGTPE